MRTERGGEGARRRKWKGRRNIEKILEPGQMIAGRAVLKMKYLHLEVPFIQRGERPDTSVSNLPLSCYLPYLDNTETEA